MHRRLDLLEVRSTSLPLRGSLEKRSQAVPTSAASETHKRHQVLYAHMGVLVNAAAYIFDQVMLHAAILTVQRAGSQI